MMIEAMPVKGVEISRDNTSKESRSDEFSKFLSKEISNQDKLEPKKERKTLDSEDDKKSEADILESLIGMLNIPLDQESQSQNISLNFDQALLGEKTAEVQGLSSNLVDLKNLTMEDISLNEEEALFFNVDLSTEGAMLELESTNNLAKDNLQMPEIDSKSQNLAGDRIVLDDSFKIVDSSMKNKPNMEFEDVPKIDEAKPSEDNLSMTFDESSDKESKASMESKVKEVDFVENKEISYSENPRINEFNKINTDIKTEAKVEVLSNDNLQRVNDAIIEQIETTTKDGSSVMKVKLYPEDLGTVDVTVTMEEGKLVAKIIVDNEHAKGLFAGKLSELSESLVKQNIQVEKINIDLNLNSNSNPENNQAFDLNQQGNFNHNRGFKYRNQVKMYNSKVESLVTDSSNIGSGGAISILA